MRLCQIKGGAERDDASGINFGVRHVVVTFDVIEVNRGCDSGLLVKVHQVTLQIRIIDDTPNVALEVAVIDDVEPNECAKETPIRFNNAPAEQITSLR